MFATYKLLISIAKSLLLPLLQQHTRVPTENHIDSQLIVSPNRDGPGINRAMSDEVLSSISPHRKLDRSDQGRPLDSETGNNDKDITPVKSLDYAPSTKPLNISSETAGTEADFRNIPM